MLVISFGEIPKISNCNGGILSIPPNFNDNASNLVYFSVKALGFSTFIAACIASAGVISSAFTNAIKSVLPLGNALLLGIADKYFIALSIPCCFCLNF